MDDDDHDHMYGALFNLFHLLKMPRQFRLFHDAETAYRTGVVCFFLLNCYTCFNGSLVIITTISIFKISLY